MCKQYTKVHIKIVCIDLHRQNITGIVRSSKSRQVGVACSEYTLYTVQCTAGVCILGVGTEGRRSVEGTGVDE